MARQLLEQRWSRANQSVRLAQHGAVSGLLLAAMTTGEDDEDNGRDTGANDLTANWLVGHVRARSTNRRYALLVATSGASATSVHEISNGH